MVALTQQGATILSAVILSAGGIVVAIGQQIKTKKKVDEVHEALKTNHGKRPGEYLEMVGELTHQVERLDKKVDTVAVTVADHTIADEVNFHEIRQRQMKLDEKIAANAEAAVLAVNAAGRANMMAKGYHDEIMEKLSGPPVKAADGTMGGSNKLSEAPRSAEIRSRADDPRE